MSVCTIAQLSDFIDGVVAEQHQIAARWRALRAWVTAQRAEADAACDRLSTAAAGAFGEVLVKMAELEREEGGR